MAKLTEKWVCPQCGTQLDIAPLGLYAEVQCTGCMHTEIVHAQVGNFRLEGVLGVGGMSVVYRAVDIVLNRPLAIKVLNDTFRDQTERIERFENESAMMARVRHENVTSVYSAGRAYGQFYIAMELVEGTNLEHMVTTEKPMEPREALSIIRSVALGLEAAHKAGLLHRDMKPGNILITPEGQAKVIDFGLAVDSKEGDTEEIIWATPYYVPPETLKRAPEDVRTDIYALGMTLRYLLTGIEKFDGPTDSLAALTECKLKLPGFAKQCPKMAPELCDLVDHMTRFSPADRPKDYPELIEEIDYVSRELERMLLLSIDPAEGRFSRIRRVAWALVGSVAAGVLLAVYIHPQDVTLKYKAVRIEEGATDNSEAEKLEAILTALKDKDSSRAHMTLLTLARQANEPALGAWCALLSRLVADAASTGTAESTYEAQALLNQHLTREDAVLDIARDIYRILRDSPTMQLPLRDDWRDGGGPWNNLSAEEVEARANALASATNQPATLRAMQWYVLALQAAWTKNDKVRERCISELKRACADLGDYQPLGALLTASTTKALSRTAPGVTYSAERLETSRPPQPSLSGVTPGTFAQAEKLMSQHKLQEAQKQFLAITKSSTATAAERTRSMVLAEVCMVASEMIATLQRKYPDRYRPGMSSRALANIATSAAAQPRILSITADSFEKESSGNTPQKAIDGNTETRWCAFDSNNGHYLEIRLSGNVPISHVNIIWENDRPQRIKTEAFCTGTVSTSEFTKNANSSTVCTYGRNLTRFRINFPDTESGRWASVREITPVAYAPYLEKELYVVGLILEARYDEARQAVTELLNDPQPGAYFHVLARNWLQKLADAETNS